MLKVGPGLQLYNGAHVSDFPIDHFIIHIVFAIQLATVQIQRAAACDLNKALQRLLAESGVFILEQAALYDAVTLTIADVQGRAFLNGKQRFPMILLLAYRYRVSV